MSVAQHRSGQHHLPAPNNVTNRISYFTFIYSTIITCYTHVVLCFLSNRQKLGQRLFIGKHLCPDACILLLPSYLSLQPNKSLIFLQEVHITQKKHLMLCMTDQHCRWGGRSTGVRREPLSPQQLSTILSRSLQGFVPAGTAWSSSTKGS